MQIKKKIVITIQVFLIATGIKELIEDRAILAKKITFYYLQFRSQKYS